MIRIRLAKKGRKNAPSYRIVVANSTSPRDGRHIEIVGFYNPSHNPTLFEYDKAKYESWVKKGAQPSEAVVKLVSGKYKFEKYNPKAALEKENTPIEEVKEESLNQESKEETKKEE